MIDFANNFYLHAKRHSPKLGLVFIKYIWYMHVYARRSK